MLNCVTVTGADDSVRPSDLAALAAEFPFVEFGILFKGDRSVRPREIDLPLPNRPRFPSFDWMLDLLCHVGPDNHLALSCHLCGQATRDFLEGTYLDGPQPINRHFRRCQVNTHGVIHDFHARRLRETVRKMTIEGQRVIFQYDGVNTNAMLSCKGRNVFDDYGDADFHVDSLYDSSHGAGILPAGWSHPLKGTGIPCGFAGGLSPENVAREIERILAVTGDVPSWIDAETHLRSDDGRKFDLDRVRLFLEAARPYVR